MVTKNKPVAVITGAASGIGLATALRFLKEGFCVAALDRSASGLAQLKQSQSADDIQTYVFDLSETDQLPSLTARMINELGPPRVLVNNAGLCLYADITATTDDMWVKSLKVNLISAAALVRGFVTAMKSVDGAAIVNVSSRNALSSSPRAVTYDASKAALLGLTRTMAVELGEYGIRVNALLPGFIDTPVHGDLLQDKVYADNYRKLIPLNRFGKPDDMANVIYFLASDEAAFITGQSIVADGGQMSGQNYAKVFGNRESFTERQRKDD
jgi:NAD(P)-dependent dehydrogenase (short-subunit alcohol dehydrogenase family)